MENLIGLWSLCLCNYNMLDDSYFPEVPRILVKKNHFVSNIIESKELSLFKVLNKLFKKDKSVNNALF